MKLNLKEAKKFAIAGICTIAFSMASFVGGYVKGTADAGKAIFDLQDKFESAKQQIVSLKNEAEDNAVRLANTVSALAAEEELVKEYEAKERVDASVEDVRDINVELFSEAKVRIKYTDQVPISVLSAKYELDPEKFGYLSDVEENLLVKYYYGAVANKIGVKNHRNEVRITYTKQAFIDPYSIVSRDTKLNAGAKVLTNYGDSKTAEIVNDVGYNLLSNIEDAYILRLKEKFANSDVPVLVNGKKLEDWSESDKIFVAVNPVVDATYSVE